MFYGVADGARTHDNRNHNPGLYQLSYSHRKPMIIAVFGLYSAANLESVRLAGFATLNCTLYRSLSSW